MMPTSLKTLRKHAQLNLCPDCYNKYLATIEPSIESMVLDTFYSWRATESCITQMVMKHKGVFKSDFWFISLDKDDNSKFADQIDAKIFNKIKRWGFQRKIDYLHKAGVLQEACYRFLDRVNDVRNRIHDDPNISKFTEQDLVLFSYAHAIADKIYLTMRFDLEEEISNKTLSDTEKFAEQLLKRFGAT